MDGSFIFSPTVCSGHGNELHPQHHECTAEPTGSVQGRIISKLLSKSDFRNAHSACTYVHVFGRESHRDTCSQLQETFPVGFQCLAQGR